MDFGRAFMFWLEDKDWLKKVAIGGVVTLIPVVNFISIGYAFRTLGNLLEGRELPLPEWDDWGGDFMRGLIPALAAIVFAIPFAIIFPIGGAMGASRSGFVNLLGVLVSCLGVLYSIAYAVVLPAMYLKYGKEGEFSSFFKFSEIIALIQNNLRTYIMAVLGIIGASIAASVVGSILCGIGVIFTSFIALLVSAHLLAQFDREVAGPAPAGPEF